MIRIALIGLAWMVSRLAGAQDGDPFLVSPGHVLLDPSRAGFAPGVQASVIHQDQWMQMPGVWRNDLLNVAWCARNTKRSVDKWLGVALTAGRDRQGVEGLRRTLVGLMPAVHLRTGPRSYLSAGIDVRLVSTATGEATGAWGSQYDGSRYDAGIPSGETWSTDVGSWVENRIGLSYAMKQEAESPRRRERDAVVVGITVDHLGRMMLREPMQAMAPLPMRFSAYGMVEVPHGIWNNGYFSGELVAHHQGPFNTARLGLLAGKHLLNSTASPERSLPVGFRAGLHYRYRDALLVSGALDFGRATISMAYGWGMIGKNSALAGRRTYELMLQVYSSR